MFKRLMSEVQQDTGMALEDLVAATAVLMQGDKPFFMKDVKKDPYGARSRGPSHDVRGDRFGQSRDRRDSRGPANSRDRWEDQRSRPGRDQQGHRDWQESRSSDSRHDSRGADRRSQNFGSPDDRSLASPGPQTRHHERTGNGGYGNAPRHETPRSVPVESDVQQPLPVMEIPKSVTHEGVTVPSNPVVVTPVVSTTVVSTAVTGKQHVIKTRADASMFDPPTPVQATSFNSDPAIPPSDAAVTGSATPPPVGDSFATRDFRRPPVETGPASDRGDRRTAPRGDRSFSDERPARGGRPSREDRNPRGERPFRSERPGRDDQRRAPGGRRGGPEKGMETFRLEVGHEHGVQPGNIVGAIANEAGIDSRNIGRINIQDDHCYVDLPVGMPPEIFRGLKDVIVMGRHLRITRSDSPSPSDSYRSGGSGSRGQRPGGDQRNHGGHRSGPPRRDGEGGGFRGRGQGDREQRSFRPADRGGRADGGRPEGGRSEGRPGRDAGGFRGGKGPRGNKFRK
ncbi:MAG: DbpA RNA binding domain-containing protein [Planctomycetaceae bacterium]|nr:DbpA RNA binding domain-containing protein [Planctomycetaceae bacterium]